VRACVHVRVCMCRINLLTEKLLKI